MIKKWMLLSFFMFPIFSYAGFPTDWNSRLSITIDNTKIDSDLSNWTFVFDQSFNSVLTSIDGPLDADGSKAIINGGGDIRFSSDEAGTSQLAVDVRAAVTDNNPANGDLELAINMPAVSSSADTTIYMWWGKSGETQPAVGTTYGQYNAYDSDHAIVIDGRSWIDRTSTQADFDTVEYGAPTTNNSSATLGRSMNFDGTDIRSTSATITLGIGTNPFSIEFLGRWNETGYPAQDMIAGINSNNLGIGFAGYYQWGPYFASYKNADSYWPLTNFHHGFVRKPNVGAPGMYYYLNGVADGDTTTGGNGSVADSRHVIGNSTINSTDWAADGDLSEYRLHSSCRSAAWAKANYNDFKNVSGFITWGSIVTPGSSSATKVFGIGRSEFIKINKNRMNKSGDFYLY